MIGHEAVDLSPPARVLLVDDSDDLRMLLRRILESNGHYEVVGEAANGRAAIEAAGALRPDLVLLDLSMPDMDGLEALPQMLSLLPPASSVVVLSGFASTAMRQRAIAAGAAGYLEKGSAPAKMLADLDRIVEA